LFSDVKIVNVADILFLISPSLQIRAEAIDKQINSFQLDDKI